MSPRIQKKQLSTLENVSVLSDQELREALKGYNQSPGPITDSTRNLYRKKLASLMDEIAESVEHKTDQQLNFTKTSETIRPRIEVNQDDDSDDTSDEDYNVQDEETSDDDDDSYDDDDIEEYSSDKYHHDNDGDLDDGDSDSSELYAARYKETKTEQANSKSHWSPKLFSRRNLILLTAPLISYLIYYLYSTNNYNLLIPLQQYKNITRQLLILLALSPIGYAVHRIVGFYRQRRYQDSQIVCALVEKSLELLQSPDNPTGLMPILHIRDTLLTPAERKTTKATNLWAKAAKFIEEHESRIKVELVNIDGEDFRAWKWIGSRKW